MRIAYITETYPPELNGVALTVHRTVEFLRARGHVLDLIRPRQKGEAAMDDDREWRTAGLPIPLYPDLRFGLARPGRLKARFKKHRPDLVHIATQGPLGFAAAKAARALGVPVTTDFRTNFHQYGGYYGVGWLTPVITRYLRGFHNAAQATFVPTHELQGDLQARGFQRLHVVGRGVDTSRFDPAHRDVALRQGWGADESTAVALYVGRLAVEKNVPLLMRAFDAFRARRPDARLVVVGDGPLRGELESRHAGVLFLGALRGEALARSFASADLFIFPSMSETFGNVVVEALASGLAVLAFDTAAAGELIASGVNGFLVAPHDDEAFVMEAGRIADRFDSVQDKAALSLLRQEARKVAASTGWDSVLQRFELQLTHVVDAYKTNRDAGQTLAERSM